jgi:transposase-like protein
MDENRVVSLRQKGAIDDPLTEILRAGARRLIAQAVEAEFETFLASNAELVLSDGRRRVVRHGHDPVRAIQTGIGPVDVQKPKARDRGATTSARIRFTSNILPKWARRTKSLDALLPVLYLRGISAGDFQEALSALLGKDAPNLSSAVIARLKGEWEDEYRQWQRRDLSARQYVYVWADGVYLQARMEPQAECMLVLIGATPEGKKELIGFQTGMRESAQSWKELLVDLKARGLAVSPQAAIGDGALGFWKALDEAFPTTRHQRCWLHKTLNVLDKLPKSMQPNAHKDARDLAVAEPGRGGSGDDDFRREIRAQIRQGRRMPDQGSSDAADVLRLPRRSLGSFANFESDRERVRDGETSHRPHEGRAVARHRASHGVQTGDGGVEDLAAIARSEPVAESHPRCKIQRRNRRNRRYEIRRLTHSVTQFPA